MGEAPRVCLVLALALPGLAGLAGCDAGDDPSGAAKAPPRPSPAKTAPAPAAPTEAPEDEAILIKPPTATGESRERARAVPDQVADEVPRPGPGESLADCLKRCAGAGLSEDDLATCKLLCEAHHAQGSATPSGPALIDALFSCFDPCEGDAACEGRCPASVAPSDGCGRGCLKSFARCLGPCDEGEAEARCAEACETAARRCLGKC